MSCTISVTFVPAVKGARTGTLIVTDNVAGGRAEHGRADGDGPLNFRTWG